MVPCRPSFRVTKLALPGIFLYGRKSLIRGSPSVPRQPGCLVLPLFLPLSSSPSLSQSVPLSLLPYHKRKLFYFCSTSPVQGHSPGSEVVTVFASPRQAVCAMPSLGQSSPASEGLGSLHLQRNKPRRTRASLLSHCWRVGESGF